MTDTYFEVTAGAGTKLRTKSRSIASQTVLSPFTTLDLPTLATYTMTGTGVSIATANDHPIELMAGSTLNNYVYRILVSQQVVATTAAIAQFRVLRVSTAGTGGSSLGINPLDTADSAAGSAGMSLPTTKGTEGAQIWADTAMMIQTVPTGGPTDATKMFDIDFERLYGKPLRIPAGTSNGICFKNVTAVAGASIQFTVVYAEANF